MVAPLGHTAKVVSDDSDVFAVLEHFYSTMKCVTIDIGQ